MNGVAMIPALAMKRSSRPCQSGRFGARLNSIAVAVLPFSEIGHSIAHMVLRMCTRGDDYGNSDKKGSASQRIAFVGVWAFWNATSIKGADPGC